MSVLTEFAMFPTDKGASVSEYVSNVIKMISESGHNYKLTAMGTIIETPSLPEALDIINRAYNVLEPYSERVYATIKLDIRKHKDNRLSGKVESIERKIGKVNK